MKNKLSLKREGKRGKTANYNFWFVFSVFFPSSANMPRHIPFVLFGTLLTISALQGSVSQESTRMCCYIRLGAGEMYLVKPRVRGVRGGCGSIYWAHYCRFSPA